MDFTIEKDLYRDNYIPEETEVYYVIAGRLKTRREAVPSAWDRRALCC